MKKFSKVMMTAAGVLAIAGAGLSTTGVVMGAGLDDVDMWQEIKEEIKEELREEWGMDYDDDHHDRDDDGRRDEDDRDRYDKDEDYDDEDHDDYDDAVEAGARAKNSGAGRTEGRGTGSYDIDINDTIDEIDIDLKYDAVIVEVYDGDTIEVEIENDDKGDIHVWTEGRELKIEGRKSKVDGRTVTLYYPAKTPVRSLEIEVDAGTVDIYGDLEADDIEIDVDAGTAKNDGTITSYELGIDVGAGEGTFSGIQAADISGDVGVGSLEMAVLGSEKDYSYELECKMGILTVGENIYEGLRGKEMVRNDGATGKMELECGMGELTVSFQ